MNAKPPETLLLVDDEEGIRTVLGIALADMGYRVLTAENAESALKLYQNAAPSIVLTDIKMPGMDGIELLRRLKNENPETEVILITGHGDMDLAIRSLKYEATDFITKPIDDRNLERALKKAGERILLRRQLREYTENLENLVLRKTERSAAAVPDGGSFRQLFDELPGYVAVIAPDFRIVAANRAFKEDFHLRSLGAVRCHQVLKGCDEPCLDCPAALTFEDGASRQFEARYISGDGAPRNVFAWTAPVHEKTASVSAVMILMTDVSRIIDLKDHLASLGLMVGSVSHGIKGLLTGLDGGMFLLKKGISRDSPEQIEEGMKTMRLMSDRIKHMVLDILYYARETSLQKEPVAIEAFMDEVAGVIAPKMEAESIAFNRRIDPELAGRRLTIDADQLRAAFVNILENAVDACLEDRSKSVHHIDFTASPEPGGVCFEIIDNGIGMTGETKENIFNLFYSSKKTKGAGIGLFISKKIVNQHEGEIDVASSPGNGTRFSIGFPIPRRHEGFKAEG